LTVADFFLQWTVVLPSIVNNETANLALFSIYNPHGIPIAIESLGYLMMNTSLFFLAPVFGGRNGIERSFRSLFVLGFCFVIGAFVLLSLAGNPIVVFVVVVVTANVAILITTGILVALYFRRATGLAP